MPNTWVTDLQHFLDDGGQIAPTAGPARRLAEYIADIVSAATEFDDYIPVRCRRRPGRKPCPGHLEISLAFDTDEIDWLCPQCGDNGVIRNWQGTLWDRS